MTLFNAPRAQQVRGVPLPSQATTMPLAVTAAQTTGIAIDLGELMNLMITMMIVVMMMKMMSGMMAGVK